MDVRQFTLREAGQGKWSPASSDSEVSLPARIFPQRRRWLLASCGVTAGLALTVGLAVVQPWALSQHRSPTTAASDAPSELEEAAKKESVASEEKRIEKHIKGVERDMEKILVSKIKKDVKKEVETDVKKDAANQENAKTLTKVTKEVEADIDKDVAKDVDKDLEKAFGHDIKKDLEAALNAHIPKGAQVVEKKDDDKGNSSKIVAAIHGCCTWNGPCDSSNAFCNVNEGKCKGCGGHWKTNTTPRDFGGWDKAWCAKGKMDSWALPSMPAYKPASRKSLTVKILDWNLAWYAVYTKKGGEGGQQGKWLASSGPYDIMGFQECQNPWRVLGDGGLSDTYHAYQGGGAKDSEAICVLYKKDTWDELEHGEDNVAEDKPGKWTYFGKRLVVWFRLRHKETKETVMFVNHHGPLPLGSGGICGGHATAYNILEVMQNNSKTGDAIILVGDFNAGADSLTVNQLSSTLTRCFSGYKFNGIDHLFTNFDAKRMVNSANLGGHGSDHDALTISVKLGPQE
mmetsp:Transcript_131184/g.255624  ORF Transcript_131184/g.255624 Transcript_131184/m.255624 type:complete len:514 (-) Transcript_131184:66-1607(-)